jgi:GNAT superfamily N-acetyltransferase
MIIRPLSAGDEADWRRMWTAYLAFYNANVTEAVYAATFARLLPGGSEDMHGLIAVGDDGAPIGIVNFIFHRHGWREEDVTYLQDLFVDEAVRGTGTGRALIEAVYAAADAAGKPAVYWMTQDFNHNARMLYDRIATLTPFIKYQR